ncbi:MAG: type IX secretion system membrane protein PorP/SprF [Cytophagales bacterium]|nr:MAG: type IX secretion system membrane protein PorP/SprF [Cytophagales bacterium]
MKKTLKYILLIFIINSKLMAQQDAQFSQYMFNKTLINPAAAGSDHLNATLLYRNQWISQPGAPKSTGFAVDAPLNNKKVGLGLIILNTSQGPLAFTRINSNYSYKINLSENSDFYLGLQAGIVQYGIDRSELITTKDISLDPTFSSSNMRRIIPDFGFGMMYKSEKFYIGLNVPHLLQSKIKFINEVIDTSGLGLDKRVKFTQIFRHYFFTSGFKYNLNDEIQIQPSVMARYVVNAPIAADLNCNIVYKEIFWGGLGYRFSNLGGVIGMLGLNISNTLKVGYAFDFTTSGLSANSGTSHEIMLSYHLETITNKRASQGSGKKKKGGAKKPYFLK